MSGIEKHTFIITPFGIEANHPRNSDLLLQCIPGVRLRSAIDGSKAYTDPRTGIEHVPVAQATSLASFPRTPGMQLHVNPAELSYTVIDPLHNNEAMLTRISAYLRDKEGIKTDAKLNGLPPKSGTLDQHRMKSLCREMLWLVLAGEAANCKGVMPDLEEIDRLPGYFLLNPGSVVPNTQPIYEKDMPDWVNRLSHSGG